LRSALAEIDPNQPLVRVRTMEENMAATVAQPRFRTWLIGIFAALALVLAGVGVYGVMSYTVTQRTSEIGIRVTLGAQPEDVFRIVVGEGCGWLLPALESELWRRSLSHACFRAFSMASARTIHSPLAGSRSF